MNFKYLIYVLSFLGLIGMVNAGTYTQESYDGMFKVVEFRFLDTKFDKSPIEERDFSSYIVEKSFMLKPYAEYESCYRKQNGCLICEGRLLNEGYGVVTNYDGAGSCKGTCGSYNNYEDYGNSAFRDDYKNTDCGFEYKKMSLIETANQINICN